MPLDRDYYTSEEIFAREYEHIYSREWIYAGPSPTPPRKGSNFKIDDGGEEIVVVRGEGDQIDAHLNVCRHRGFRLCAEETGKVRAFVCPYHQWRFDLDGTLRNVPKRPTERTSTTNDYPPRTAQVEVWHGLIFVNLRPTAGTVGRAAAAFDNMVDKFAPERTKLVHQKKYTLDANWKVAVENALECYHCAGTHARVSVSTSPG